jgi:hypothetical protein
VKYFIAYVLTYSLQNRVEDAYSYVLAVTETKPGPAQIAAWKDKVARDYIESEYYAPDELLWEKIGDVWVLKTDNHHFDELHIIEAVKDEDSPDPPFSPPLDQQPMFRKNDRGRFR